MKYILGLLVIIIIVITLKDPKPTERSITITAFGDSLTEGYRLTPQESYPAQLESYLKEKGYTGVRVINKGVSGNTTSDGVLRLDDVYGTNADIYIIALGANDGLRRMSVDDMRRNLETVISKLRSNGATVILAGVDAPALVSGTYGKAFEQVYEDIATTHNVTLIANLLSGVSYRPSLNLEDMLHPNAQGYAIVAKDTVGPVVIKEIQKLKKLEG